MKFASCHDVANSHRGQIIDVREYPEYVVGHIEGSMPVPLGTLGEASRAWPQESPLVLVCRSGKRARQAAESLEHLGFPYLTVMEGGMEAWQAAGRPVRRLSRAPWSLERQLRVIAGLMVLCSMLLAATVSSWFLLWASLVGAGLIFAGVTDVCLLASLLGRLPWNRAGRGICRIQG